MKTTIIRRTSRNCGQIKIEDAESELKRLNEQDEINTWRADKNDFLYVPDETDDEVSNPCALSEGYVWLVTN